MDASWVRCHGITVDLTKPSGYAWKRTKAFPATRTVTHRLSENPACPELVQRLVRDVSVRVFIKEEQISPAMKWQSDHSNMKAFDIDVRAGGLGWPQADLGRRRRADRRCARLAVGRRPRISLPRNPPGSIVGRDQLTYARFLQTIAGIIDAFIYI